MQKGGMHALKYTRPVGARGGIHVSIMRRAPWRATAAVGGWMAQFTELDCEPLHSVAGLDRQSARRHPSGGTRCCRMRPGLPATPRP
jgi:hypothetical protein